MKLHQNLFYYYKGAHQSDKEIQEQLENNLTKAFINVIEKSDLNTQKKIIENIIPIIISKDILKINYTLQEKTIGEERINQIKKKFILGLSSDETINRNRMGTNQKCSIPDAWIWTNDFVILIENKLQGTLDQTQLDCHRKLLDGQLVIRSWKKVYQVFKKIENNIELTSKDKLLIQEFNDFLEMIGMTEFTGFRRKDLSRMYSEDKDEIDFVREKFKKLGNAVSDKLEKKGVRLYHEHRAKPDEWWDYFVRDKSHSYYTLAHFSIYTCYTFLGVKLHLQKPGSDFTNFKKKINEKPDEFKKLLFSLKKSDEEYEIELEDKEHVGGYDTVPGFTYTIHSKYFDNEKFELFKNLILNDVMTMRKPCLSLRREFDIDEAEKLQEKLVDKISDLITDWLDIYNFIIKP
jgi:hypothetical protein